MIIRTNQAEEGPTKRLEDFVVLARPRGSIVNYFATDLAGLFGVSADGMQDLKSRRKKIGDVFDSFEGINVVNDDYDLSGLVEKLKGMFAKVANGSETSVDGHDDFQNGGPYHLHYSFKRMSDDTILFTMKDESELTHLKRDLKKLTERYRVIMSHVAHNFRGPVNGILRMTGVVLNNLEAGELNDNDADSLRSVVKTTTRLVDMCSEYLGYYSVERGELRVNIEDYRLQSHIMGPIMEQYEGRMQEKNVKLKYEPDLLAKDDPIVRTDLQQTNTIIDNLIGNAIKYCTGDAPELEIGYTGDTIYVKNTGSYLAEDECGKIFDEFYRLDRHKDMDRKGTGLGLSLSREFARLMGGDLTVESDGDTYTKFILHLPKA